ncbi:MAG: hypothetical protein M1821_005660 [Bathelium mastoideum]|nr:MAG: hypothetical protein M1821_005660 [Bathelium mastoideum]
MPATTPITMPAMAPPDSELLLEDIAEEPIGTDEGADVMVADKLEKEDTEENEEEGDFDVAVAEDARAATSTDHDVALGFADVIDEYCWDINWSEILPIGLESKIMFDRLTIKLSNVPILKTAVSATTKLIWSWVSVVATGTGNAEDAAYIVGLVPTAVIVVCDTVTDADVRRCAVQLSMGIAYIIRVVGDEERLVQVPLSESGNGHGQKNDGYESHDRVTMLELDKSHVVLKF